MKSTAANTARRSRPREHAHGFHRVGDLPQAQPSETTARPIRRSAGFVLLIAAFVAALATVGIARVRASNRVLALGVEVTALTREHAELLELKRRLEAERAYLRHPDRILEVATQRLGFVAVDPHRIKTIEVAPEKP